MLRAIRKALFSLKPPRRFCRWPELKRAEELSWMMSGAASCITMLHIAMHEGVQTIGQLFSDATRTEVAKHEAAQIVAKRSIERLQKINRQ
ncbi:hypothetical protein O987_22565 [Comamonas testosteroni TK102]|uniref:Uncharacterized protein n=1 Tax=Comamonas testosteroni TK102 TaxID=1392005 RepID=A0A076PV59_COMTE|nr:hypothetical protein O987_22565 [Comamonas testosteroni TK102]